MVQNTLFQAQIEHSCNHKVRLSSYGERVVFVCSTKIECSDSSSAEALRARRYDSSSVHTAHMHRFIEVAPQECLPAPTVQLTFLMSRPDANEGWRSWMLENVCRGPTGMQCNPYLTLTSFVYHVNTMTY